MKNNFALFYLISVVFSIIGALLKINHYKTFTAETSLIIALITNLFYIVIGLIEINKSTKINGKKKLLWNLCFIIIPSLTGLFYLLNGRKRII